MRQYSSLWPEVVLYVSGVLMIALGLGCCIVSVDPQPFHSDSWWEFLLAGVLLMVVGSFFLATLRTLPTCCPRIHPAAGETTSSAADLLEHSAGPDAVENEVSSEAPISKDVLDGVQVVKNCMMTQSPAGSTSGLLFYRETFV